MVALAKQIYLDTLKALAPERVIPPLIERHGDMILALDLDIPVGERLHIFGAGKASARMAAVLREIVGPVAGGLVVTKDGHGVPIDGVEVIETDHPIPGVRSIEAGRRMRAMLGELGDGDTVLFALSGGASALLEEPAPGITLADLRDVTALLLDNGAEIAHVNAVRSALSLVKAGGLARAAAPARTVVLAFSDVPGGDPAVLGSGPFDQSARRNPLEIVRRYGLLERFPESVVARLREGAFGAPPKVRPVPHRILSDNASAMDAMNTIAMSHGLRVRGGPEMTGDVAAYAESLPLDVGPGEAIVAGGEVTVMVRGDGRGGRCQELAARLSRRIAGTELTILVGSTDGTDGPTTTGGAVVTGDTLAYPGPDLDEALSRSDAHSFLAPRDALVETGPTGTNVNDLILVIGPSV